MNQSDNIIKDICEQFPFPTACGVWDYRLAEKEVGKTKTEKLSSSALYLYGELQQAFPWMSVSKLLSSRVFLAAAEHKVWRLEATLDEIIGEEISEEIFPVSRSTIPTIEGATQVETSSEMRVNVPWREIKNIQIQELLAHCSGLAANEAKILCAPRQKRIYSNFGYELLAAVLEKKTGIEFYTWLHSQVLSPLAITEVSYTASPAWGISGKISDLAIFALEAACPQYLAPSFQSLWFSPFIPNLPGILPGWGHQRDNLWGLGPEIKGDKRPHWLASEFSAESYGHFGQSGSFLWVDPQVKKAGFFLGEQRFGKIHQQLWPKLSAAMRKL